jgi:hypothetical protein
MGSSVKDRFVVRLLAASGKNSLGDATEVHS